MIKYSTQKGITSWAGEALEGDGLFISAVTSPTGASFLIDFPPETSACWKLFTFFSVGLVTSLTELWSLFGFSLPVSPLPVFLILEI